MSTIRISRGGEITIDDGAGASFTVAYEDGDFTQKPYPGIAKVIDEPKPMSFGFTAYMSDIIRPKPMPWKRAARSRNRRIRAKGRKRWAEAFPLWAILGAGP